MDKTTNADLRKLLRPIELAHTDMLISDDKNKLSAFTKGKIAGYGECLDRVKVALGLVPQSVREWLDELAHDNNPSQTNT